MTCICSVLGGLRIAVALYCAYRISTRRDALGLGARMRPFPGGIVPNPV